MTIVEARTDRTYRVEFTDEERDKLRAIGWISPQLGHVAAWLTTAEIASVAILLDSVPPVPDPLVQKA